MAIPRALARAVLASCTAATARMGGAQEQQESLPRKVNGDQRHKNSASAFLCLLVLWVAINALLPQEAQRCTKKATKAPGLSASPHEFAVVQAAAVLGKSGSKQSLS